MNQLSDKHVVDSAVKVPEILLQLYYSSTAVILQ